MNASELAGLETLERRASPRTRLQRLAYIRVEPSNGAIVVDATRAGIRFFAVAPLHQDGTIRFSFSLPGNRRVEAAARLVWTDETKKSGGLEFSLVPSEVVEQILDCCLTSSLTLHNDQKLELPAAPSNHLALSESLAGSSLAPVILPESQEACTSLVAVPAIPNAAKTSRVTQGSLHDPEAWKKWIRQMPLVEWLRAVPKKKRKGSRARNAPASKMALPAFLMAILFLLPILLLPQLAATLKDVTVPVAAPLTRAPLPPAARAESQRPWGELITSPQLVPGKSKSAERRDQEVSLTGSGSAIPSHSLSDPGALPGSHSSPGETTHGSDASRVKGVQGAVTGAGFGNAAASSSRDAANSPRELKMSVFDAATAGSQSPKLKANDMAAALQPLVILEKPSPVYTEEARRLAVEGEVLIEVVFSAGGQVRIVRLAKGLGHGLDEAAMDAAQQIRFEPAQQNGQPVDVPATVHILFQLAY